MYSRVGTVSKKSVCGAATKTVAESPQVVVSLLTSFSIHPDQIYLVVSTISNSGISHPIDVYGPARGNLKGYTHMPPHG